MMSCLSKSVVPALILSAGAPLLNSQTDGGAHYRVDVNLVALTFSVADKKGGPVTGLKPEDVRIFEDGIEQKIAAFAEGSTLSRLTNSAPASAATSVFILFDTSNRMYNSFPYVWDAIRDYTRRLAAEDSVAIYTFSRNLFRAAPLTRDHFAARAGLSNISAGDDTALFNSILLTLRDAAQVPGRKAIVVFSNGPDTASTIDPDDVGRVAEDEGIPVYVISSRDAVQDPMLYGALQNLTARSGGKLYGARNWQQQVKAFTLVREDIGRSYTAYYYPAPNPNRGFRSIKVEIAAPAAGGYRIAARPGYQARREPQSPAN